MSNTTTQNGQPEARPRHDHGRLPPAVKGKGLAARPSGALDRGAADAGKIRTGGGAKHATGRSAATTALNDRRAYMREIMQGLARMGYQVTARGAHHITARRDS